MPSDMGREKVYLLTGGSGNGSGAMAPLRRRLVMKRRYPKAPIVLSRRRAEGGGNPLRRRIQ